MYVSIREVTVFQAGFDSLRQGLQCLGLSAVEIALSRNLRIPALEDSLEASLSVATPEATAQAAHLYREASLRVSALFLANNFNAPDRKAEVAWAIEAVRVAEAFGARVVRLDGAMSGPDRLSRRRRVALYAECLQQVLEATPGSEVCLAVENHGRQGGDLAWLEELLAAMPSPRVGLTLDPANLYWAGYPLSRIYRIVARLAPRVRNVHVKNIAYPEPSRERQRPLGWEYGCCVCPAPEGDLDFERLACLLAATGYSGALTIEEEALAKYPPPERPRLLQGDVAYLRKAVTAACS